MKITILTFAQTRLELGFCEKSVECDPTDTPLEILRRLAPKFDPAATRVAIDLQYHDWHQPIGQARELALIPPVSGG